MSRRRREPQIHISCPPSNNAQLCEPMLSLSFSGSVVHVVRAAAHAAHAHARKQFLPSFRDRRRVDFLLFHAPDRDRDRPTDRRRPTDLPPKVVTMATNSTLHNALRGSQSSVSDLARGPRRGALLPLIPPISMPSSFLCQ